MVESGNAMLTFCTEGTEVGCDDGAKLGITDERRI